MGGINPYTAVAVVFVAEILFSIMKKIGFLWGGDE